MAFGLSIIVSILLDTHILFWWIAEDPRLPVRYRALIEAGSDVVYVSAVSGWEIAVKVKLGKWPEAAVLVPGLTETVLAEGFEILDLTLVHAERAGLLDLSHKDPFDRLIAAQSLVLDIPVATVDPLMSIFGCRIV